MHARETNAQPGTGGPTWDRLEDQINCYDQKSRLNQSAYKCLKALQLVAAAAVPVAAVIHAPVWITACLGVAVLVIEGLQQLGQFQQNWISYRYTTEALKHEKFLYLAAAGPYTSPIEAPRLLAERLEGLVSQKHAKWSKLDRDRGAASEENVSP